MCKLKIIMEIIKYLEMYNKSATNQNLWDAAETLLRRKLTASECISGKIRMESNELSVQVGEKKLKECNKYKC